MGRAISEMADFAREFFCGIGVPVKFMPAIYTLMIMFTLLIVSYVVNGINIFILRRFPARSGMLVCRWLTVPGVVLHECSHAFFALITGAKVTKVVFFGPKGDTLGYVSYRTRGGPVLSAIQRMLSSVAPIMVGPFIIYGMYMLFTATAYTVVKIFAGYIMFSMFVHMDLSDADVKEYLKGCGVTLLIVFLVCLILLK